MLKLNPSFVVPYLLFALLFFEFGCNNTAKNDAVQQPDKKRQQVEIKEEPQATKRSVLFYGNSLTAGYGLAEEFSFPSLIQGKIDSSKLEYSVINAGLSGETTSGGVNRIEWVLQQKIDVFILELGGNDVLRGLNINETEKNLTLIVEKVKAKFPNIPIIIAGMMAPPNMGENYAKQFNGIYPRLAKKFNAGLIPFLLEDVATIPSLNLRDGIHPNAEGQKIVAENVWNILQGVL